MHFSAQEAFGLRCVIQLAKNYDKEAVTARQISKNEKISLDYVHKLLGILKRKGLICSTRGIKGGFRLNKEPSQITVWEVLNLLCSELNSNGHCTKFLRKNKEICHGYGNCHLKPFVDTIFQFYRYFSSKVTVMDLVEKKIYVIPVNFAEFLPDNSE